jgi:hypothetical protein
LFFGSIKKLSQFFILIAFMKKCMGFLCCTAVSVSGMSAEAIGVLVNAICHGVTSLPIKKPSYPTRQPGCLNETRGFPSLPHNRFGFFLSKNINAPKEILKSP